MGIFSKKPSTTVVVPRRVVVAGTSFRQREIVKAIGTARAVEVERGSEVIAATFQLQADPRNAHDPNAVKVLAAGRHVGFLPKGTATWAHDAIRGARGSRVEVAGQFVAYDDGAIGVVLPAGK